MRVSEVYASVQGEGPRTGETTVFCRFGGCNLRCPGWPCDTQHAIDPKYRSEWEKYDPNELADKVHEVALANGAKMITLTGGEPFLQNKKEMQTFIKALAEEYKLEAFTNGTLPYTVKAVDNVRMIMDWKLPGSGEDYVVAEREHNLKRLADSVIRDEHAVKFVCKHLQDLLAAHSLWSVYLQDWPGDVYYGRVWDGEITNAELVEYVMKEQLPWMLNVQMHNYIWSPQERGR